MTAALSRAQAHALLDWYAASGVDTAEGSAPSDFAQWPDRPFTLPRPEQRRRQSPAPAPETSTTPPPIEDHDAVVAAARAAAESAETLSALRAAIEAFEGCPLKAGARKTVVCDGVEGAPLLVVGEAPGRDEDREGRPFVGRAGQLLDRMLAAIGLSRRDGDGLGDALITNAIYWRPPGNRTPTAEETAICLPFLRRFITLANPSAIVLTGNVSTQSLFPGAPGITRSRGQWRDWPLPDGRTVPVLPTFHPAFLLRSPAQKRLAWVDLLAVASRLDA